MSMSYQNKKMAAKVGEGKGTRSAVPPAEPLSLPDSEYKYWREAIVSDDHDLVSRTLDSANWEEKERLLNGYFLEHDGWSQEERLMNEASHFLNRIACLVKGKKYLEVSFERPWCLAGACGSLKVLSVMYQHGVQVDQTDRKGSNILHILIYLAFLDHLQERAHGQVYAHLVSLLSLDHLKLLLKSEGKHGLYPLEMSAWLGTFTLYQQFTQTEGVYCHSECVDGVRTVEKYDVTDYETFSGRHFSSPLNFLMLMDDKDMGMDDTNEVFQSDLFKNWLCLKKLSGAPYLAFWIMIRITFLVAYSIYDSAGGWDKPFMDRTININVTVASCQDYERNISKTGHLFLTFYILIHSVLIFLGDIVDFFVYTCWGNKFLNKGLTTPNGVKNISLNYSFYRGSQLLLATGCIIGTLTSLFGSLMSYDISWQFTNYLYVLTSMNLVWSMLFFLQLSPFFGYFIIAVQSMMMDLMKFALIFVAFAYPYSETFARLVNQGKTDNCPQEFSDPMTSFYSTFTVMVNMVDFHSYDVADKTVLYLLHVIYVFTVPILLLNFLVALFSNSVSHVQENKDVFGAIQWLSVLLQLEYRLGCITRKWKERCNEKYFLKEGDRLYVPVITIKSRKKVFNDKLESI